jgi:hypothetical protein
MVKGDYKKDLRQLWLDRARENELAGLYSESDIYLIEWLLVGDCKIFFEKLVDGEVAYEKIWECLLDFSTLSLMDKSPTMEYCCRLFDSLGKGPFPPNLTCLVARTEIAHSVAIMMDTDGNVYHRSRRTGQFCKVGTGGGEKEGSCVSKHFSCREGLKDELGVDFNNPAVLWVSQPIIEIAAPHDSEQARGKPFTLCGCSMS